ncbi:peptidoglycan recognition protein family protein [Streptomyces kanamyceticus]|uniref:N-acetylmuramoyl-L-alanine amidase n=1 Tax=Streptomyces kanamyceticus TaxID=1967 RepID=A0A5J6GLP9_STRKN|nr:peptidoglycan recognition protein [Streptomyces kanamyceticus]QEU93956.1 N-acetylmuramoyl-L-alanine amidase [Streptomyces kanamyceticus]
MRGFLASSIGVTCAAALALPLTLPSSGARAATPAAESPAGSAVAAAPARAAGSVPGSTQSLPLTPAGSDRSMGSAPREEGIARRDVRPFSLVGVVWDDPEAELHGTVQVRTRATGTIAWSAWQGVETHNHEHAADPGTPERGTGAVRGSTAPLWVGDSDGIELRVRAESDRSEQPDRSGGSERALPQTPPASPLPNLPKGLRLDLVDPGDEPPLQGAKAEVARATALTAESAAASAVNADLAPIGAAVIPELTERQTEDDLIAARGGPEAVGKARPYIGPRPRIITRKGWGADEKLREKDFAYTRTVKAAFVHHSASGNNYSCSQAGSVLRSIYRFHVKSSGWRDFGYNFAVDKCGNIYEGRAGGVAKPVLGAHTLGFNTDSMGIAVLGTYSSSNPPKAAVNAVARLTAWKLGLYGANPRGSTYLKSGGGNLYKKGSNVRLRVISGHRDGFATECPGSRLYKKLGKARSSSARFQGR